jgi:peptidoglycan/xylan/chitin deacetylase (PgdA/CDA1 family)
MSEGEKTALSVSVLGLLADSGLSRLCASRWGGVGSILALHRVQGTTSPTRFGAVRNSITPEFLRSIIVRLTEKGYEFVTMSGAAERITHPRRDGRKFVALTFDDGFVDTYREALPICRSVGVPMTVYVMTGAFDGQTAMWWLGLDQVVARRDHLSFPWQGETIGFSMRSPREKRRAHVWLSNWFVSLTPEQSRQASDLVGRAGGVDFSSLTAAAALSEPMTREMVQSGIVEFGAHTVNHPNLRQLDPAMARQEIRDSRNRLSEIVGTPVRHFAYPYGSPGAASPREFALLEELGFETGVTTRMANVMTSDLDHLHALPRLTISGLHQDTAIIDLMLSGMLPKIREAARMFGR